MIDNVTYLSLSWSTSRARDTYGYNIVRLTDQTTRKSFSTMGVGYDMVGTVFGKWLESAHDGLLQQFAGLAYSQRDVRGEFTVREDGLYGMSAKVADDGRAALVRLDGACGIESMLRIANTIGLEVRRTWDAKGQTTGFIVGIRESS